MFHFIHNKFSTLAFCPRWLEHYNFKRYSYYLKNLVKNKVIENYPPLGDIKKSYVSQFEHTLILKPSGKEILSFGEDY